MNDLEKELQMMMQEKAARLSPSEVAPRRTLRRTRARQTVVASVGVAAVTLATVGVLSAGTLFRTQDDRGLAPVAPPAQPSCSSAGLSSDLEPLAGLPPEVEATRQAIVDAAVRCDYEALEALTGGRQMYFLAHGLAAPAPAAEYWQQLDEEHVIGGKPAKVYLFDPMRILVQLLKTPYAEWTAGGTLYYQWPSVLNEQKELTEADWEALATVYSDEEVRDFRERVEQGGPYYGYTVSIREDGVWNSFTAGD